MKQEIGWSFRETPTSLSSTGLDSWLPKLFETRNETSGRRLWKLPVIGTPVLLLGAKAWIVHVQPRGMGASPYGHLQRAGEGDRACLYCRYYDHHPPVLCFPLTLALSTRGAFPTGRPLRSSAAIGRLAYAIRGGYSVISLEDAAFSEAYFLFFSTLSL